MIRTGIVRLTVIQAVAYRQKLTSGGSGIVIIRGDVAQPGIASISKTSGEAILTDNTSAADYPQEAFTEAMALTSGMPYKKLGSVKYVDEQPTEEAPEEAQEDAVVESSEYLAVVAAYTNKDGKLSYDLLNRDMIQFAHKSQRVQEMIADMATEEEIRAYVAGVKFRDLTGNHDLSDAQIQKIIGMLDEVSPKGVMREFNDEIRLKLKASKKTR